MTRRLVIAGVALWGLIAILAVHLGPVRVLLQDHLEAKASLALADAGVPLDVTVRGLHAELSGTVTDPVDSARAVEIVRDVDGVVGVSSAITARTPSTEANPSTTPEAAAPTAPAAPPASVTPTATTATTATGAGPADPDGAAVRAAVAALAPIAFEPASAELTDSGTEVVEQLAAILAEAPAGITVRIEAHTDTAGPDDLNKALSIDRASAVRSALIERGVSRSRVAAVGLGETRPVVVPETSDEDRAANRRVEIVVLD